MTKISNQYSLTNILTADLTNSRLGINNVSPTVALDVTGAGKFSGASTFLTTVTLGTGTASGGLLRINQPTNDILGGIVCQSNGGANGGMFHNTTSLVIREGGVNTMYFAAGNVGIGTSSPSQKLEVIGTTKLSSAAGNVTGINIIPDSQTNIYQTVGETTNGPNGLVRFYANIVTGWANYDNWGSSYMDFKVQSRGTGTSDQSSVAMGIRPTLDIRMTNLSGSGSRAVMADANGQLSASVSDITLKENIIPIGYGLNEIMQMNPVWFDFVDGYKNYGEGRQNGNIAQEIAEIIPEAVFTTPQTGKMGINYEQLHAVYIKAIQELKAEIDILKNK